MVHDNAGDTTFALRRLAEEPAPAVPLGEMMERVRARARQRDKARRRWMRGLVSTGAVVALIIALLTIPVSYSVQIGSFATATWTAAGEDAAAIRHVLEQADEVSRAQVAIRGSLIVATAIFRELDPQPAAARLRSLLAVFVDDPGALDTHAEAIHRTVGGNALAAATGGYIRIHTTGLSREEIEDAIEDELVRLGARAAHVTIDDAEGGQAIEIDIDTTGEPGGPGGDDHETQITIELLGE